MDCHCISKMAENEVLVQHESSRKSTVAIWSLDHQYHGKHVPKFSSMAIYGRWIVSATESMCQSFAEWPWYYSPLIISSMKIIQHNFCH